MHITNRSSTSSRCSPGWSAGLGAAVRDDESPAPARPPYGYVPSRWVALSRRPGVLEAPIAEVGGDWRALRDGADARLWTDDYASVLPLLRWRSSRSSPVCSRVGLVEGHRRASSTYRSCIVRQPHVQPDPGEQERHAEQVDDQVRAATDADGVGDPGDQVGEHDRDGPHASGSMRPADQEAQRRRRPCTRCTPPRQRGEEQQLDDHAAALIRSTASSKRMLSAL